MKKSIGIFLLTATLAIGCKSQTTSKNDLNQGKVDNTVKVAEVVNDKPVLLTKQDFLEKIMDYEKNPTQWVYKGELPSLIDFYADWCAPCRISAPILDDLAKEYAGKINIYKIDVQKEQELAGVFGVQGIPAFLYVPVDGNPSMTSGIGRSPEETKNMFKQNIETILLKNSGAQSDL